jgi:hypothetical protein
MAQKQRSPGLSFNLHDQLVFYGSYHSRGWNQAIHFVFVPLIMWSAGVLLAYAPALPVDLPSRLSFLPPWIARRAAALGRLRCYCPPAPPCTHSLQPVLCFCQRCPDPCGRDCGSAAMPNGALVLLVLYTLFYTALEPVAGLTWGALLALPMWLTATAFQQRVPYAWAWALGVHALSWFAQARLCLPLRLTTAGPGTRRPAPGLPAQALPWAACSLFVREAGSQPNVCQRSGPWRPRVEGASIAGKCCSLPSVRSGAVATRCAQARTSWLPC